MTREHLFTSTLEPQLVALSGWKALTPDLGAIAAPGLSPGDLPGFILLPGATDYGQGESIFLPMTGRQLFTIRIYFGHPQRSLRTWSVTRSDHIGLLELFFNTIYSLPTVSPGDPVRIDAVRLASIEPATLDRLETRSVIAAHGSYDFTLL